MNSRLLPFIAVGLVCLLVNPTGHAEPALEHLTTIGDASFRSPRPVMDLAIFPDGKRLAGGTEGGTVRIWDAKTGQLLQVLPHQFRQHVSHVLALPDNKRLLTAAERTVSLWDATSGKLLHRIVQPREVTALALRPRSTQFGVISGARIVLYDWDSGAQVQEITSKTGLTDSLCFPADGKRVIASSRRYVLSWDLATGETSRSSYRQESTSDYRISPDRKTISMLGWNTIYLCQTNEEATVVWKRKFEELPLYSTWSPDGRTIAVLFEKRFVQILNAENGKTVRDLKRIDHNYWYPHHTAFVFSNDGRSLFTGGRLVHRHDVTSGELVFPGADYEGIRSVLSASAHDDDLFLLTSAQSVADRERDSRIINHIDHWNLSTGARVKRWVPGDIPLNVGQLSPNGRTYVVGDSRGAVSAFDTTTQKKTWSTTQSSKRENLLSISFLNDKEILVGGGAGLSRLEIGSNKKSVPLVDEGLCYQTRFSPDGRYLALNRMARGLEIHDLTTGKMIRSLETYPPTVFEFLFTPDSETILARNSFPHLLKAQVSAGPNHEPSFDHYHNGEIGDFEKAANPPRKLRNLTPSPNGKYWVGLATQAPGSDLVLGSFEGTQLTILASTPTVNGPRDLAWHPDGNRILVMNHAGTVDVYRMTPK